MGSSHCKCRHLQGDCPNVLAHSPIPSFPRTREPRLSKCECAESLGPRVRGDDEQECDTSADTGGRVVVTTLASICKRSEEVVSYDPITAAQHQLEGAIHNLFIGNWVSAITLAQAAEGILPQHPVYPDFMKLKPRVAENLGVSERFISDTMNKKAKWLRHDKSSDPNASEKIEISQLDAAIMILRAFTRFAAHHMPIGPNEVLSEQIFEFQKWLRTNYPDFSIPSLSGPDL